MRRRPGLHTMLRLNALPVGVWVELRQAYQMAQPIQTSLASFHGSLNLLAKQSLIERRSCRRGAWEYRRKPPHEMPQPRKCLCCAKPFMPIDRRTNWLCQPCGAKS